MEETAPQTFDIQPMIDMVFNTWDTYGLAGLAVLAVIIKGKTIWKWMGAAWTWLIDTLSARAQLKAALETIAEMKITIERHERTLAENTEQIMKLREELSATLTELKLTKRVAGRHFSPRARGNSEESNGG